MMYSKNGSIPSIETDGTEGWIEVPDMPTDIPEGKELRWLNYEWIIRDPKPDDRPGYQYNWNHDQKAWIEYEYPAMAIVEETPTDAPN